MIYTSMKKNIFFVTLCFFAIIFNASGQCDSPSQCMMDNLVFDPIPVSTMPVPTFDLDCSTNTIKIADFNVNGASSISYTWYTANTNDFVSDDELALPPPGNYRLEVAYMIGGNPFCCSQEIIVNDWGLDVNMEVRRQGGTTPVTEVCIGENVGLFSMPNTFVPPYVWTSPNVTDTTSNDAAILLPTLNSGDNAFSLRVQDSNGCVGFASVTLMVNPLPILQPIATPTPLCEGGIVTVNAGVEPVPSQIPYTYSWSTTEISSEIFDTPSEDTNYSVTVTDANGCISEGNTDVQVNPIPDATITTDTPSICEGQPAELSAPDADSYLWIETGDTTQSITIMPEETTDYIVEVTEDGCTNTDTITITVITSESITIMGDDEICEGDTTTLTAPEADEYMWSTGSDMQSIIVSPTVDSTYSVTITDGGCTGEGSKTVIVKPKPIADIDQINIQICEGDSTTLTAQGGETYEWSTGEMTPSITVFPIVTTPYTVTVTASNGCTDTETRGVEVISVDVSIIGDNTICEGDTITLTTSSGGSHEWSTGETTPEIMVHPTETTTYIVTKTVNDCSAADTITVNVNPVYSIDLTKTICPDDTFFIASTPYTEAGMYTQILMTMEGCDSIIHLDLTEEDIISHDFFADSLFSFCTAQTVTFNLPNESYEYTWSSSDDIMQIGDCVAFELGDNTAISLEVSNGENCFINESYSIDFMQLPDTTAKVLRLGTTNTLFCNRNDFASYQWGRESRTELCPEPFDGEIYQNYLAADIDAENYYYWVEVTDTEGCQTRPCFN